jgi:hypothetical protein
LSISRAMPSPGGQASGMANHQTAASGAGVDRVWRPPGLPPGATTRQPGGRAGQARAGTDEGCPRADAWSG